MLGCRAVPLHFCAVLLFTTAPTHAQRQADNTSAPPMSASSSRQTIDRFCVRCHNQRSRTAGLELDTLDVGRPSERPDAWEKVLRKVQTGVMPPTGAPQPDPALAEALTSWLTSELDRSAVEAPNTGPMPPVRRLTRTEYGNAIRDLLGLSDLPQKMALELLLPADNVTSGFDNVAELLFVSPTTLDQYLTAARKVSRLALGDPEYPIIDGDTFSPPPGQRQDIQLDGFPAGTRGGVMTHTYVPVSGEYQFTIAIGGLLTPPEQLEISVDDERVHLVRQPTPDISPGGYARPMSRFQACVPIQAGRRKIAATFVQSSVALDEAVVRSPLRPGPFGQQRVVVTGERERPPILSMTISRPSSPVPPESTPARDRIFVCRPGANVSEAACAERILSTLARRAYRRPITGEDLGGLVAFYEAGRHDGDFEEGIKFAIQRILVSPQFLFRTESQPADLVPGTVYRVSDLELASRLSFFLWSSIPDDELLELAERGTLSDPVILEAQVHRMLQDPRARSLVTNFAEQWLYLRDLDAKRMDYGRFPQFDEGLRRAMQKETELFLESVLLENQSVLDLLRANYTFVNERLAKHYGIKDVYGMHFRRVTFDEGDARGGLLGHGSILVLTSHATRTSPVGRGKWILENLLASPPPPPPAVVPPLVEQADDGKKLSMRDAMVLHRRNPACASCHVRMDPLGLALEHFNAIGAWQSSDASGAPLDVSGVMPDGTRFDGLPGLQELLTESQSQTFVTALTEKLVKYALGRDLTHHDAPVVRQIVREAAHEEHSFYALVRGIVTSLPFQARTAAAPSQVVASSRTVDGSAARED